MYDILVQYGYHKALWGKEKMRGFYDAGAKGQCVKRLPQLFGFVCPIYCYKTGVTIYGEISLLNFTRSFCSRASMEEGTPLETVFV